VVLRQIIQLVKDGTLGGQAFQIDLANQGEVIELNPDYPLTEEISTSVQNTIKGISEGTITIELPQQ
jgi:hypothetical protein